MKRIYIAMAEFADGNRIFEKAYFNKDKAQKACDEMIKDIRDNTDWMVAPVVEDLDLDDEQ